MRLAMVAGEASGDLLAGLAPPAAGPTGADTPAVDCVREAPLGGASGGRLVNRGIRLPAGVADRLREHFRFYDWDASRNEVRWMCSFDTSEQDIDAFVAALAREVAAV